MSEGYCRKLSADERRRMHEDVQGIIRPFAKAKFDVLALTMPTLTEIRDDSGVTISASYPFDLCDRMCERAVQHYLESQGFVYGFLYGDLEKKPEGHTIYG